MDDDWPLWWDFIYVGTLPLYFIALILEAGGLLISLLVMYAVVAAGLPLLISHAERLLGVAIYSKVRGYIYWPERL